MLFRIDPIDLKKMFLGFQMDCSHHGAKLAGSTATAAGVAPQVGFPL
jgi:hypothetical protein